MNKKILIVLADYYKDISDGLLKSALKKIPRSNRIKIIRVPGVFEIPVTISKNLKKFDAFLALGCAWTFTRMSYSVPRPRVSRGAFTAAM